MKTSLLRLLAVSALAFTSACSNDSSNGAPDAAADSVVEAEAGQGCTGAGVCASGPGFTCAVQFPTTDCFGGICCFLAPDAGPSYYDDAGTCPGMCASPDDIGCPTWYRSNACAHGTLCCVLGIDAGSDAADAGTD